MSVRTKVFGTMKDGHEVTLYSIQNQNGMIAEVMDYGAILVNLLVPDHKGEVDDIVLGYDKLEDYYVNGCFFGAVIGPSANRIAKARFSIDGVTYQLPANDNGNNLHSDHVNGYPKRIWNAEIVGNGVRFTLDDPDGSMGFPGNKHVEVTYTLTEENELRLDYHVTSDKKTLINMTNHSYFNLAGHNAGSILQHKLQILADAYTPVIPGSIPTGEIAPVKGTPFDFTTSAVIGERIEDDNEQLKLGQGYDHNWVLDHCDGSVRKIAEVTEPVKGRTMTVYSDQPGMQFYAGNCISPHKGKANAEYGKRCGLALETQAYPDSVNRENFPDVIYGPDREYKTTTIYKLSW